jgi:hypothetical protein
MEQMNCCEAGEKTNRGREQNQTPIVLVGETGDDAQH